MKHKKTSILFLIFFLLVSPLRSQSLKKLGLQFNTTVYNFGDIAMWENQAAIFKLTNNTKQTISILPLFSEVDLDVIYPEKSIKPNETVIIKAIYYTSGTGNFSRRFPIYFDISDEPYYLKITGNIKSLSPTAYIQCPQSKPSLSKHKLDLVGYVSDIDSDLPVENAEVELILVGHKTNTSLKSDPIGYFNTKLPKGNYQVLIKKDGYETHSSFFYLGQNTGHLKVQLVPLSSTPILTSNQAQESAPETEELKPLNPSRIAPEETPTTKIEKETIEAKDEDVIPSEIDTKSGKITEYHVTTNDIPETEKPVIYEVSHDDKNDDDTSNEITNNNPTPKKNIYTEPIPTRKPYESYYDKNEEEKPVKQKKEYGDFGYSSPNKQPPKKYTIPQSDKGKYAVRIIDEKTYQEIPTPTIKLYKKQNDSLILTDVGTDLGLFTAYLPKTDYVIKAEAPNYTSKSINVNADKDGKIIRVYLTPNTEINTAITEHENNPIKVIEVINEDVSETQQDDEEPKSPIFASSVPKEDNKHKLDSIQRVLAEIEAEKLRMELALAKANLALTQKELELSKKEADLYTTNAALEKTQEDLENQNEMLQEKEKELTLKESERPNTNTTDVDIDITLSKEKYAANNVLFLIDISSSMGKGNKMELLKESMKNMVQVLRDIDKVAIITYNQKTNVIIEGITGLDKTSLLHAVDSLQTYGLTYGVRGLQMAYDLLDYHYIGDGNNQIILATDGLFSKVNATMTESELNREVKKKAREKGIKLSVVGFGQDEEGDKLMQKLAENGEGQYIKINSPWEARTVLIDEIKLNSKK